MLPDGLFDRLGVLRCKKIHGVLFITLTQTKS
jgi:hypothetical protein